MAKAKWFVSYKTHEAAEDVAFLFSNEDIKDEIKRILKLLIKQIDPRSPKADSDLIVDELEHDARGWFRVKVPRYAIRIVFRLVFVKDNTVFEIQSNEPIPSDIDESFIEIMQAAYRKDAFGEELRKRYEKYREDIDKD